ncbi:FCD domain-containing protein, partial [Ensifer sp. ENS05]|uniref:FCD domain-containing protein n=1 Tax=Ensifer sp. ENS05 TaxID=2769277 RepID=UPI0017803C5F
ASLRDLTHGVPLKIFAEIRFAHDALPASKLGKKASTNLGAIQTSMTQEGRLADSVAEIEAIYDAIAAGDADRAEAACRLHIDRASAIALSVLKQKVPASQ